MTCITPRFRVLGDDAPGPSPGPFAVCIFRLFTPGYVARPRTLPCRVHCAVPAHQPPSRPPGRCGCTRSSTTASGSSPARDGARVKLYSRPGNDLT